MNQTLCNEKCPESRAFWKGSRPQKKNSVGNVTSFLVSHDPRSNCSLQLQQFCQYNNPESTANRAQKLKWTLESFSLGLVGRRLRPTFVLICGHSSNYSYSYAVENPRLYDYSRLRWRSQVALISISAATGIARKWFGPLNVLFPDARSHRLFAFLQPSALLLAPWPGVNRYRAVLTGWWPYRFKLEIQSKLKRKSSKCMQTAD